MAFTKKDAEKLLLVSKQDYEESINKLKLFHDAIVFTYHEVAEDGATDEELIALEDEAEAIRAIIDKLKSAVINVYSGTPTNGFH